MDSNLEYPEVIVFSLITVLNNITDYDVEHQTYSIQLDRAKRWLEKYSLRVENG